MGVRPNPLEHGRYWDATLNVVGGCEIVDRSCRFCYAPPDAAGLQTSRDIELYKNTTVFKHGRWTWNGRLTVRSPEDSTWTDPLRWKGAAEPLLGKGKPSILWVNSMSDLFHPGRPIEAIHRILQNIAISPHNHIGLVLTKHPAQMVEYFSTKPDWWRKRFWLGFSASDQRWFERRWRIMRQLAEQGWLVFVSIQPMLGPVVVAPDYQVLGKWVICGGEQHPGHRWMNPDWARSLRDQCQAAGLPFFVKQMTTGWLPPDLLFREFPKV